MKKFSIPAALSSLFLWLSGIAAVAQIPDVGSRPHSFHLYSGTLDNPGDRAAVVFEDVIDLGPEVPWVRVVFSQASLPPGSAVRVTSLQDGESQTLDALELARWGHSTAFFNGPAVRVELLAGPRTRGASLRVEEVIAGRPLPPAPAKTICGSQDNRVPSSDPAVGRLMIQPTPADPLTGGCTGFIIDCPGSRSDKCHLSAGHCFVGPQPHQVSDVLQFDVPASQANCSLVHPGTADQFAVDRNSVTAMNDTGSGEDWAVFRVFRNPTTLLTSFEEQGAAYPLAGAVPLFASVRVTGYGKDATGAALAGGNAACADCNPTAGTGQRHQTQQTATGTMTHVPFTSTLNHTADTCGGTSGGPVVRQSNGEVLGIHTNGGACSTLDPNFGTAITNGDLEDAIEACESSSMLVLLDRTGSMNATRPATGNTRCTDALALAKQDVATFFSEGGEAAAVWTFRGSSASDLTGGFVDQAAATAALDGLSPTGCSGSTPLAEAICDASDALAQTGGSRILAISSDGGENNSSGACSGPNSASGPPYDANSWQRKVRDKVLASNVVLARFWGSVTRAPAVDPETGQRAPRGAFSEAGFFADLATVTSGEFQAVPDDEALPPPFLGPFFADGFESSDTSAWSATVGASFDCLDLANAGFEASPSALAGWTQMDAGNGLWSVQSGTTSPTSGFPVPLPPQGTRAAMSDQLGPGRHILYVDVDLPPAPAAMSFELYVNNRHGAWIVPPSGTLSYEGEPNQHVRVDVMDPAAAVDDVGSGVLMNVLRKGPGDPVESGYDRVTADLSAFAGRRVRLRFAEVDNQLYLQMGVDDVRICRPDLISRAAERRRAPRPTDGGSSRTDLPPYGAFSLRPAGYGSP